MDFPLNDFAVGHVVVPAQNGTLAELGFKVRELGERALGIILTEGGPRSLVHFPDLKVTLWLENSELADVQVRAFAEEAPYQALIPDFAELSKLPLIWIFHYLMRELPLVEVLEVEHGELERIWDEEEFLEEKSTLNAAKALVCARLGLGLQNVAPSQLEDIKVELGNRLLALKLHAAGMHKFEARFYLR
jgi:hypothetical protein